MSIFIILRNLFYANLKYLMNPKPAPNEMPKGGAQRLRTVDSWDL